MESRQTMLTWWLGLYALSLVFVLAGLNHFRAIDFYRPMMPPYMPAHDFLIYASGAIEFILGLALLYPPTRPWGAWGIILLLVAFMPVHIFMLEQRNEKFVSVPTLLLWLRVPAQALLIWWAFVFTRV